jgi:hypothetical protein
MATLSEPGDTEVKGSEEIAPGAAEYPHGTRLAAIVVSLMLGMFLVALDNVRCLSTHCL